MVSSVVALIVGLMAYVLMGIYVAPLNAAAFTIVALGSLGVFTYKGVLAICVFIGIKSRL